MEAHSVVDEATYCVVIDTSEYSRAGDFAGSRLDFSAQTARLAAGAVLGAKASHACLMHGRNVIVPPSRQREWKAAVAAMVPPAHGPAFSLVPAIRAALLATRRSARARLVVLTSSPVRLDQAGREQLAAALAATPGRAVDIAVLGGDGEQSREDLAQLQLLVDSLNGGGAADCSRACGHGMATASRLVQFAPPAADEPAWEVQERLLELLELRRAARRPGSSPSGPRPQQPQVRACVKPAAGLA